GLHRQQRREVVLRDHSVDSAPPGLPECWRNIHGSSPSEHRLAKFEWLIHWVVPRAIAEPARIGATKKDGAPRLPQDLHFGPTSVVGRHPFGAARRAGTAKRATTLATPRCLSACQSTVPITLSHEHAPHRE